MTTYADLTDEQKEQLGALALAQMESNPALLVIHAAYKGKSGRFHRLVMPVVTHGTTRRVALDGRIIAMEAL